MPRFFINHPDIKPRAQSQQILVAWYVILRCILLITIFHSRSLVFNCIAVQCSCSICGHSSSLVFHSCSLVFHSCWHVFHSCSLVFRLVWSFRSDPWNTVIIFIRGFINLFRKYMHLSINFSINQSELFLRSSRYANFKFSIPVHSPSFSMRDWVQSIKSRTRRRTRGRC